MKSLSILFAFFTVSASLIMPCVESQLQNCPGQLLRLKPCMGEIFSLKRPISSSCCARISQVSAYCPRQFRPRWFVEGEESCIKNPATPPPPPSHDGGDVATPPPPASPSNGGNTTTPPPPPPPPSNGGGNEDCPDAQRLVPCLPEMIRYGDGKGVISSSCCATLLDVKSKCSTQKWNDFFTRRIDYCKNHH